MEDWGKLFQDVPGATAILDRILHHCHLVPIVGRSKRWPGSTARKSLKPSSDDAQPDRADQ